MDRVLMSQSVTSVGAMDEPRRFFPSAARSRSGCSNYKGFVRKQGDKSALAPFI